MRIVTHSNVIIDVQSTVIGYVCELESWVEAIGTCRGWSSPKCLWRPCL
jgi:hypothetical protein